MQQKKKINEQFEHLNYFYLFLFQNFYEWDNFLKSFSIKKNLKKNCNSASKKNCLIRSNYRLNIIEISYSSIFLFIRIFIVNWAIEFCYSITYFAGDLFASIFNWRNVRQRADLYFSMSLEGEVGGRWLRRGRRSWGGGGGGVVWRPVCTPKLCAPSRAAGTQKKLWLIGYDAYKHVVKL